MVKSGELNLLDNETNSEIGKLALNLKMMFNEPREVCEAGSILKKNTCGEWLYKCENRMRHSGFTTILQFFFFFFQTFVIA